MVKQYSVGKSDCESYPFTSCDIGSTTYVSIIKSIILCNSIEKSSLIEHSICSENSNTAALSFQDDARKYLVSQRSIIYASIMGSTKSKTS